MKRFVKYLLLFSVPFFAILFFAEYMLRRIPDDYSKKAAMYSTYASKAETLIIGSSYALYDLDPTYFSTVTLNGGHLAQSLDIDRAIFSRYADSFTKLRYLILPVSDVSLFFKLGKSGESWRTSRYASCYGINVADNFADYFQVLSLPFSVNRNRLISYYVNHRSLITISDAGYGTNYKAKFQQNMESTALDAVEVRKDKNDKYFDEQKNNLEEIIAICKKKKIRVILFMPPAYKSYIKNIDTDYFSKTIAACESLTGKYSGTASFYDFLKDQSFSKEDFFDAVHLNEVGAKKMSLKIDSLLKGINE